MGAFRSGSFSDEYCGDRHPRYALMREMRTASALLGWFRHRLYERDGGICQLCGHPVSSLGFHLDHIVPKSKGGAFTWDNLRLAHRGCNSSRSHGDRSTPVIDYAIQNGGPVERISDEEQKRIDYYLQCVRGGG